MLASGFGGIGVVDLVRRTIRGYVDHEMSTYAAALAFRALLALFPFTIFLVALLGALGQPEFFTWLLEQARAALPGDAFGVVRDAVAQIRGQARGGLISAGILLALWAASTGVRSLMWALNAAYGVRETRPLWLLYSLSVLYTIGLAAMLIAGSALMLIGPEAAAWLADHLRLSGLVVALWTGLRWPVAVALFLVAVAIIYDVAPDIRQPFTLISPGAVLAVTVWAVASVGFSSYVTTFGTFSATYGSLAGVVVLLLYFYLSAAVLLLGAEVNAVIYHATAGGRMTPARPAA